MRTMGNNNKIGGCSRLKEWPSQKCPKYDDASLLGYTYTSWLHFLKMSTHFWFTGWRKRSFTIPLWKTENLQLPWVIHNIVTVWRGGGNAMALPGGRTWTSLFPGQTKP